MRLRKTKSPSDLFRSHLEQMIDMRHPLVRLSKQIDWTAFEKKFGSLYTPDFGRPGLLIRLMVGLTYLSRIYDLSDEAVVELQALRKLDQKSDFFRIANIQDRQGRRCYQLNILIYRISITFLVITLPDVFSLMK